MIIKILNAGSGGQGVLTMGNIMANAAMFDDYHVTYLPEYGAAMRGGTANCTVSISDEEIASPVASNPDIVIAMNHPSAVRFLSRLQPGGQLIYNSNLVDDIPLRGDVDFFPVPANEVARELGNERSANMVLLGAFLKHINIIKIESIEKTVNELMKKKLVDITLKAIGAGYNGFPYKAGL